MTWRPVDCRSCRLLARAQCFPACIHCSCRTLFEGITLCELPRHEIQLIEAGARKLACLTSGDTGHLVVDIDEACSWRNIMLDALAGPEADAKCFYLSAQDLNESDGGQRISHAEEGATAEVLSSGVGGSM